MPKISQELKTLALCALVAGRQPADIAVGAGCVLIWQRTWRCRCARVQELLNHGRVKPDAAPPVAACRVLGWAAQASPGVVALVVVFIPKGWQ